MKWLDQEKDKELIAKNSHKAPIIIAWGSQDLSSNRNRPKRYHNFSVTTHRLILAVAEQRERCLNEPSAPRLACRIHMMNVIMLSSTLWTEVNEYINGIGIYGRLSYYPP
jgi:hypothetical protein